MYFIIITWTFKLQKEEAKKAAPTPSAPASVIHPEGKTLPVDSLLLIFQLLKILYRIYKSSGYKTVWQSQKNRKIILKQLLDSGNEGLNPGRLQTSQTAKLRTKNIESK